MSAVSRFSWQPCKSVPASLVPSVNYLLLTPHWTSLGALQQARGPGICYLLLKGAAL